MTECATPPIPRPRRRQVILAAAMFSLLALVLAGQRLHTYDEPLDRDVHTYALIGQALLEGRRLYVEVWDHKPPGVYLAFAATEWLAGDGRRAVFLLNLATAIAAMGGVFCAARALGATSAAGWWAATFWVLMSADPRLQANQPNTELLINALHVHAFALLLFASWSPRAWKSVGIAGILFALASLMKMITLPVPACLAAALVLIGFRDPAIRGRVPGWIALLLAAGALFWGAVFVYFAASGGWTEFVGALFDYNKIYAPNPVNALAQGMGPSALAPPELWFAAPFVAVIAAGAWMDLGAGGRREWILYLAWGLGTWAAISMPGRFFPHYYQLWLPPLAVGAGAAVARLAGGQQRSRKFAGRTAGVALAAWMTLYELPAYNLSPVDWSRIKYQDIFWRSDQLAREIDDLLEPGETFFTWGDEPGLYWTTRRTIPSYDILNGLQALTRRDGLAAWAQAEAAMSGDPPQLAVVNEILMAITPPDHPVRRWLNQNYALIPGGARRDFSTLYARRSGALEARLRHVESRYRLERSEQGDERIAAFAGKEIQIAPGAASGYVELVEPREGFLRLRGWASDESRKLPAGPVLVFLEDRFVWEGATGLPRPDLEWMLPSKPPLWSDFGQMRTNFGFLIEAEAPAVAMAVGRDTLRVFACDWGDQASELTILEGAWPQ